MAIPPGGFAASKNNVPSYAAEVAAAAKPAAPVAAAVKASPAVAAVTDGAVVEAQQSTVSALHHLREAEAQHGTVNATAAALGVVAAASVGPFIGDTIAAAVNASSGAAGSEMRKAPGLATLGATAYADGPATAAKGSLGVAALKDAQLISKTGVDATAKIKRPTPWQDVNWHTIEIGSGNDHIEIFEDAKGVHIVANGKEVWKGSREQFEDLNINTGEGDDVIINHGVRNATINTGAGNDHVTNWGRNAVIDTGEGDDAVLNRGEASTIDTGGGADAVDNRAVDAQINTGDGNDHVYSDDYRARINTGRGSDTVVNFGHDSEIDTGSGDDKVSSKSGLTKISTGTGNDTLVVHGGENTVNSGDGDDNVEISGNKHKVDAGAGADVIKVWGDGNAIQPGLGVDRVRTEGRDNTVQLDLVEFVRTLEAALRISKPAP